MDPSLQMAVFALLLGVPIVVAGLPMAVIGCKRQRISHILIALAIGAALGMVVGFFLSIPPWWDYLYLQEKLQLLATYDGGYQGSSNLMAIIAILSMFASWLALTYLGPVKPK